MKATRVIITHTLVAACVWLIVAKRGALSSPQAETEQPNGNAANSVTSSTRQAAKERNTRSWAISDYQKAWADLPGLKLNKADRRMMQRKILQGWAEKDLEGALRAAFADHVQDASMLTSGSERLTKIFGESIIQRTDDYWQLIQSGKLGILNTEILSAVWVNCLGIRDATILKPYIAELKGNTFAFAILSLQRDGGGKISSSELMSALELREKNGLWQPCDEHVLMDTMKTWFSGEEMRALLSRTTPHLQKAITKSLAAEYSSHPDQPWQETIVSIPESLRASFADGVMSISPINRGLNPQESAIKKEAIDYLVAQQQWTILEASGADDAVRELARSTDPKQLAE